MADLPNTPIPVVPAESPGDLDYPTLVSITVADLVGPVAANRQPNQLKTRAETLRDRVNQIIADLDFIETGGPGSLNAFLPRDGGQAMGGALDMGTNQITAVVNPTLAQDAATKAYVDSLITPGSPGYHGEIKWRTGPATPGTLITVEQCFVADTTNAKVIQLSPASGRTIDITGPNGIGGLDTGVMAAATWYYLWAIGDSTLSNPDDVILSLAPGRPFGAGAAGTPSGISPVMPGGYDLFRRIGAVRTEASAATFQSMRKVMGVTMYESFPAAPEWSGRVFTFGGGVARAPISAAEFIPPISTRGVFRASLVCTGANFGAGVNIFPGGQIPVKASPILSLVVGGGGAGASPNGASGAHGFVDTTTAQVVDISVGNPGPSGCSGGVDVVGFIDDMKHIA